MRFWRVSSGEPGIYAPDDLTGEGARRYGARWNAKGTPAVYASYHLAMAVLETLVHVGNRKQPESRYVVAIDVAESLLNDPVSGMIELPAGDLPKGWNANPPNVSQAFGAERFKLKRIGFAAPSAIIEEELNVILNPLHPAFRRSVQSTVIREFAFDPRL